MPFLIILKMLKKHQCFMATLLMALLLMCSAILPVQANSAPDADQKRTDKILTTFLTLVKMDSPSGQEEQVRQFVEARLHALGIKKLSALSDQKPGYIIDPTGNLIVFIPATAQSVKTTLLIDAHMDAVPPCLHIQPVIKPDPALPGDEKRVVYSSGDTVLSGDDKAALAPLLEALETLIRTRQPHPDLLLTITAREELGAVGASDLNPAIYASAPFHPDLALSFDINGDQGTVVFQAPQLTLWDAAITGRSAHAGIDPENGINALRAAVLSASQIQVGRLDPQTTANIGTIQSGLKFNIVPGSATVSGEVRSFTPRRVDEQLSQIEQSFQHGIQQVPGSRYALTHHTLFDAYHTDLSLSAFEPLKTAIKQTGLTIKPIQTNGGSDANVYAKQGIPSVVLSGAFNNMHQKNEFVRVRDLLLEYKLMLNIMTEYARTAIKP